MRVSPQKRGGLKTGRYRSKNNRKHKHEREGDQAIALMARTMR
jgi:hypothetical protein